MPYRMLEGCCAAVRAHFLEEEGCRGSRAPRLCPLLQVDWLSACVMLLVFRVPLERCLRWVWSCMLLPVAVEEAASL